MNSIALYYFLEFIEKKKCWDYTITLLDFWVSAEKYKRLIWRIGSGIVASGQTKKIEKLSATAHERLQKEVSKIYDQYLKTGLAQNNRIQCNSIILASFQRYIESASDPTVEFAPDDYQCVIKAQRKVYLDLQRNFNEFEHSPSYFQLSNVLETERATMKNPKKDYNDDSTKIDAYDNSALLTSLSLALAESCKYLFKVR